MATQRTFSEFMSICEAVYGGVKKKPKDIRLIVTAADKKGNTQAWKNYKAGDKRYRVASHLGEDSEIDEKFSMAADSSQPQSPKATKLPKSRERNVGKHDDWKDKPTEWGERPAAGKKLRSRASAVVGTQKRQDVETGVRKEETELDEVLMVTPAVKKPTKTVVKSVTKLEKPDPSDPDYVRKQREYVKSKQQEAIDYERLKSGAEAATDRAAAVKKAKLQRQQSDAESARTAFRTKGVPFSDAKGSGHIVNGKKVYAS